MTTSEKDLKLRVLLCQYSQCWEERRVYAQLIWQTPTISMAIVGVLVGGLIAGRIQNPIIQGAVFLASFFVLWIGILQLRKHRFLQIARNCDFEAIQKQIQGLDKCLNSIRSIKFKTDEIIKDEIGYPDALRSWWDRRSAYDWLFWSIVATSFISLGIGIGRVIRFFF